MADRHRGLALAVGCGATVWMLLLVATPFVASHDRHVRVGTGAAAVAYATGALVCHQKPERSFVLGGSQMSVCARCTGLYAAAPWGAGLGVMMGPRRRRGSTTRSLRLLLVFGALPTLVTVAGEFGGVLSPSNMARALSALPLGFVIAWTVCRSLTGPIDDGVRVGEV